MSQGQNKHSQCENSTEEQEQGQDKSMYLWGLMILAVALIGTWFMLQNAPR